MNKHPRSLIVVGLMTLFLTAPSHAAAQNYPADEPFTVMRDAGYMLGMALQKLIGRGNAPEPEDYDLLEELGEGVTPNPNATEAPASSQNRRAADKKGAATGD